MMFTVDELVRVTGGEWAGSKPSHGPTSIGHDTRCSMPGGMYVAIVGDHHDGHDFLDQAAASGASMAMVQRPVSGSLPQLVVSDSIIALGQLASAWRDGLDATTVISITGTAGKTSTKDLMQHVLQGSLRGQASPASWNNAIGGPMSLLQARRDDDYVILEVGTSSPGEIASLGSIMRPDLAVITLVGHGHLEGLGSLDGVRDEKYSLLDYVQPDGLVIVHDDGHEAACAARILRHGDRESSNPRLIAREAGCITLQDESKFEFPWAGQHHAVNALAVIAVARHLGLDDQAINQALATSTPSHSRGCEKIACGIRFIDDAYNANPDSVAASLASFPELSAAGRRVVMLGDMLELGLDSDRHHAELASSIDLAGNPESIDVLLLFGEAMSSLHLQFKDADSVHYWPAIDDEVITEVAGLLQVDDLVLVKGSRGMRLERIIEYFQQRESEASTA
ncbi:MAG: UDP-N-acetylmuramoyl-tripeptide--D-alanyl-D-alanine ligase [Phycisphaerales bacterium]|nr:UDP-N-acetylmuramoyl-tripeptide--D-alanyl-D-alanine ligase [Phycisphaerales bacterium]